MIDFKISKHAEVRSAQRNIGYKEIEIVLRYGTDLPAGVGVSRRFLQLCQLQELQNDGYRVQIIERALGLELILKENGLVITCYKARIGRTLVRRKKHRKGKRINRLSRPNWA
jgi:hypothetical protein